MLLGSKTARKKDEKKSQFFLAFGSETDASTSSLIGVRSNFVLIMAILTWDISLPCFENKILGFVESTLTSS